MTPPPGTLAPTEETAAVDQTVGVPARAEGVELLGQLEGSGYQNVPFLVRRADGQTLQLTSLLYATLACVDGQRTYADIAATLCEQIDRQILAEDVACLVEEKLRPMGVLAAADGSQPTVAKANPLLGLRWRFVVSNPTVTRRITRPFSILFRPYVAVPILVAFAVVSGWLLLEKGLASATHEAFYRPGLLLLIFALTMLSAGFHEFGHAAACRYGGATPGAMGGGLYLVWPAFFTDVTDSYRLGRWGRIRVDVGGLYFNAIFAAGMFGVWWLTRWDALLLIIPAQLLQMARQLLPFVRFDGYHILADVTGVPDLFAHIKPTLLALAPSRWRRPPTTALKPWARVVVTAWVLLVIPILLFSLVVMVKVMPRVAATAWDSLGLQWAVLQDNWAAGAIADVGVRVLAMFTIALPVAAMTYMLARIIRRTLMRTWRSTEDRPVARALTTAAALVVVAALLWFWWPQGQYRPVEKSEQGTLLQALSLAPPAPTLVSAAGAAPQPLLIGGAPTFGLPTAGMQEISDGTGDAAVLDGARPRLGLVLTPADDAADGTAPQEQVVVLPPTDEVDPDLTDSDGWPFPFDPPSAPEAGDNQSLAVNTQDGSTVYDVSFAVVWVTGEQGPVDQTNEAYALASCTDCSTVAVAFQVVLILGQADVVVPQNYAVAVNYECMACQTYALAVQLVATLTEVPSDDAMAQISALEAELAQLEADAETIPLDELYDRLTQIEQSILQILGTDTGAAPAGDVEVAEPSEDPAPATFDDGTDASTSSSTTDETAETGAEDDPAYQPPADNEASTSDSTDAEEETSTSTDSDTTTAPAEEPSAEPAAEPTAEPSDDAAATSG